MEYENHLFLYILGINWGLSGAGLDSVWGPSGVRPGSVWGPSGVRLRFGRPIRWLILFLGSKKYFLWGQKNFFFGVKKIFSFHGVQKSFIFVYFGINWGRSGLRLGSVWGPSGICLGLLQWLACRNFRRSRSKKFFLSNYNCFSSPGSVWVPFGARLASS